MRKMANSGSDKIMFISSENHGNSANGSNHLCQIGKTFKRDLSAWGQDIIGIFHKTVGGMLKA